MSSIQLISNTELLYGYEITLSMNDALCSVMQFNLTKCVKAGERF